MLLLLFADVFQNYFFQKKIHEHFQNIKLFGSRSGLTECPNYLQRLAADEKSPLTLNKERVHFECFV